MAINDLQEQAIRQALNANWQAALDLNLQILKKDPEDIDALCRLARAYAELNKKQLALKTYRKVIRLDRFNTIAKKNLARFSTKTAGTKKKKLSQIDPCLFLEEPGKTKVVALVKLGSPEIILDLNAGDQIKLILKKRSISVYDKSSRFLGKLPDDLSSRLIKLIKSGNKYQAVVKSVSKKSLSIFIKETERSIKNSDIPSFPFSKDQYYSFIPAGALKREPIEEIEGPAE